MNEHLKFIRSLQPTTATYKGMEILHFLSKEDNYYLVEVVYPHREFLKYEEKSIAILKVGSNGKSFSMPWLSSNFRNAIGIPNHLVTKAILFAGD